MSEVPGGGTHVAGDSLAHIAAVLRDEATVEAVQNRPECEHEAAMWRDYDLAFGCAPCDLAIVAERLGVPHVDR